MKFEKGTAIINIGDFVESVYRSADAEQQREIADSLACIDPVIDFVVEQIVEGWTELSSQAARDFPAKSEPATALDRARRFVALHAGDVAAEEAGRLQQALALVEKRAANAERRFDALLDEVSRHRPENRLYYLNRVDAILEHSAAEAATAGLRVHDRVIYVPGHAHGDIAHPDCEHGTVQSFGMPPTVFVLYDGHRTPQATTRSDLVRIEPTTSSPESAA